MKGQTAMEYLITYSWAIVAVVIIIGFVAASGIFNPTAYGNEYCVAPSQIPCDSIYSSGDDLYLKLRNNFGFDIDVDSFTLTDEQGNSYTSPGARIARGDQIDKRFSNLQLKQGGLNRLFLTVTYSPCQDASCSSNSYDLKITIYTKTERESGNAGPGPGPTPVPPADDEQ